MLYIAETAKDFESEMNRCPQLKAAFCIAGICAARLFAHLQIFHGAFALAGRIAVDSRDLSVKFAGIVRAFPQNLGMNHRYVNNFVISLIAIVLVYYSVAWAVLRCFHDEDHTGTETAVSVEGPHQRHFVPSHVKHTKADIDCMGSNYHTETLAGSSTPSQLRTLTANIAPQVTGFLTLQGSAELAIENLWLWALFDRGSTLPFPTHFPRYLSLSVLRI